MRMRNKNFGSIVLELFRIILFVVLFPVVLIYFLTRKIKKYQIAKQNAEKINIYTMKQIDSMSGLEFENLLKSIFEKMGYSVKLTKPSHDYGADLVISRKGEISVVQAKCYGKTVGVKSVQEAIAAKKHYGAKNAYVASNREFSRDAETLALENDVKLIDRSVLENLIKKTDVSFEKQRVKALATKPENIAEIEAKYRFWI